MSARDAYIASLYNGSSSGSSTGTTGGTNLPGHPGNQNYSSSNSGSTNYGSNVNTTSGVGTNVGGITGLITDPKADEDAGVYEANQNLFDTLQNTYTSPKDTYASDLNNMNIDSETVQNLGLLEKFANNQFTLSDEVLNFYGVDPANPQSIPPELYQMIAEGSIVTNMEAMNPGQVIIGYDKKTGNPIIGDEPGIGTYSDLEAGNHSLLGSKNKYYKIMSGQAFPGAPTTGGGGSSSGYGGGGGGNAAAYAMMNQGPKQLGAGEDVPGQTELLDYMVNVNRYNPYTKMAMPQMAAGGIMELMR